MNENKMNASELKKKLYNGEPVILLDVRDEEKFQSGTLVENGVQPLNIPYLLMRDAAEQVSEQMKELPKDTPIITLCTSGNKAQKAAMLLREQGFSAVALEGGLTSWQESKTKE